MKTLDNVQKLLQDFDQKYGIGLATAQQGSDAWFRAKLGVISASRASEAVAGKKTATRLSYLAELVSEVCTGVIEEVNAKALAWGKDHEDAARSLYEFESDILLVQVPFVFRDGTYRVGCSPDGLCPQKPAEIKCPWDTTNYIKFLVEGIVKPDWKWQNQFTMWVLEAGEIDVAMYDPRMKTKPGHRVTVLRDPEMQKQLDDTIPELVLDMDAMLKKIGVKFGEQWTRELPVQEKTA